LLTQERDDQGGFMDAVIVLNQTVSDLLPWAKNADGVSAPILSPHEQKMTQTAGEAFAKKFVNCPVAQERLKKQAQAVTDALGFEEFIEIRKEHAADWEKEFGEPFPNTIGKLQALQIRLKMGSGWTFSDDAFSDEMWGKIEGYLKGLQDRKKTSEVEDGPCGHCKWRHNGTVVEGTMQVGAWKVCQSLWVRPDKSAGFDDLYEAATDDRVETWFDFRSAAQKAKQFFDKNRIPWRLSVSEKHRTATLVKKKQSG